MMIAILLLAARVPVTGQERVAGTSPEATSETGSLRLQSFSVIVRDYDEALAWYRDKLGFVVVRDQSFGAGGQRFILVAPTKDADTGIVLQLFENRGGDPSMAASYADRVGKEVNIVLRTADVTGTYEELKAKGVAFSMPPRQQPWGGEALFSDLYGNTFVLVGPLHRR
jgi:catechol 2,3-dioxygenase-like lactoylglutathione lyase family enzyme